MWRDERVSLCVDDEEPPFSFVLVEGTAGMTAEDPDHLYWATRIAGRYMGAELAEAYGRRNAIPGELLIRVTLDRIVARKNIADCYERLGPGKPQARRSLFACGVSSYSLLRFEGCEQNS
jgi:hypothetical protein